MKNQMFKFNPLMFTWIFCLLVSSLYANLIDNGSFEYSSFSPDNFVTLTPGDTNVYGWIVTRGEIEYYSSRGSDGLYCLELDGLHGVGGVMQYFTTVPGTVYKVNFDMAGNYARLDKGPLVKRLRVIAAGQYSDFEYEYLVNKGYINYEWSFTATSNITSIEFYSLDDPSSWCGPFLDNVVVEIFPDPVSIVSLDIKPTSCPNALNIQSNGVLPVAILGSDIIDVNDIDISSLNMLGVKPVRTDYEDVATPISEKTLPEDCICTTDGPDGFMDLALKFDKQQIIEAIGPVEDDEYLILTLIGNMIDGTSIEGTDCVWIINKSK